MLNYEYISMPKLYRLVKYKEVLSYSLEISFSTCLRLRITIDLDKTMIIVCQVNSK